MAHFTVELDLSEGVEPSSYERYEEGHGIQVKWPLPERYRCLRCGHEEDAHIEYRSTPQVIRDLPLWEQPSFFIHQPPFHRSSRCSHRQDIIPPIDPKRTITLLGRPHHERFHRRPPTRDGSGGRPEV